MKIQNSEFPIPNSKQRLQSCDLCPRQCHVDRTQGECGFCGNDATPRIYQHFMHLGEEITIVPAFIINMAGCNLTCPTCPERFRFASQRLPIHDAESYAQRLAQYFINKRMPKSLEWIGGEPSVQLPFILQTSEQLHKIMGNTCPQILLNTNGYFDANLLNEMKGTIDGFVFDLKCLPSCQKEITGAEDYWETVTPVILRAYQIFDGPYIVRHLVMPGHTICCTRPIIEWCRQNIPRACFNLMTGFEDFRPERVATREITRQERENARQWFMDAHFENCLLDGSYFNGQ